MASPIELFNSPLFNDPSLVSYWRLEGNSNDSKGSVNGSDTSISYSTGNGKFGQGASFNGTTSKSDLGATSSFNFAGDYTITLWFNCGVPTVDGTFIGKEQAGSPFNGWSFRMWFGGGGGNVGKVIFFPDSAHSVNSVATFDDNAWHMATVTRSGNTVSLYVDAGTPATVTAGRETPTTNTFLGCDGGSVSFYSGKLDDVAIFTRALTTTEISNLFTGSWPIAWQTQTAEPVREKNEVIAY